MKSLFAFIGVLAVLLVTGGLYYFGRSAEKKASDRQLVQSLPTKLWEGFRSFGHYLRQLFASKPEAQPATAPKAA